MSNRSDSRSVTLITSLSGICPADEQACRYPWSHRSDSSFFDRPLFSVLFALAERFGIEREAFEIDHTQTKSRLGQGDLGVVVQTQAVLLVEHPGVLGGMLGEVEFGGVLDRQDGPFVLDPAAMPVKRRFRVDVGTVAFESCAGLVRQKPEICIELLHVDDSLDILSMRRDITMRHACFPMPYRPGNHRKQVVAGLTNFRLLVPRVVQLHQSTS